MIANRSFQRDIPVTNLQPINYQSEGLARLKYTLASKGFGVITGSPGTGKSTLLRQFEASLDKSRYLMCYINDSNLKPKSLYIRLLEGLSIQPYAYIDKMKKQFSEGVMDLFNSQKKLLIIVIDNAHELPVQTIKELRYLMNFYIDSASMLCLVLVGHPELWSTLKLQTFKAVYQCVSTHYSMPHLDEEQTKDYIAHQLKLSGVSMCFPEDTVKRIFQFSSGIPREINKVCLHCLIDLEANKLELVDNTVLDRVFNELQS